MNVGISIIICTRNRKEHLAATLESLERLATADGLDYEILVIDNGSDDGTHELIHEFVTRDPQKRKYFFEQEKGLSRARNCGIRHARGEIIAFTDDDVVVDPDWLVALWNTFESKPNVVAVQGMILLQKEIGQLPPWIDPDDLLFLPYYAPHAAPCYSHTLVGANMTFRREAFKKYGLFDPRLGTGASGYGDDTEFGMRLEKAGEKIFYQPTALVFHEYLEDRFTWDYWLRRIAQHAQTVAVIDVQLRNKKVRSFQSLKKLIRYYVKYYLYAVIHKTNKKYKYDRKIRYIKGYMKAVGELRNSASQVS